MNELELKNIWQSANARLEANFSISKKNTEDISRIKVYNLLGSMKPLKIFTLLVGILWVGAGASILTQIYLYGFAEANKFFLYSASLQVLLTAIALYIYLYQLVKIYQVDIAEPILKTQKSLNQLKISTLWSARIVFLQLPVWTTFWWNERMLSEWNWLQWSVSGIITLLFVLIAGWLFFNIRYENRNKKWFRFVFNGKEWTPLIRSMELLEQVETYQTKQK